MKILWKIRTYIFYIVLAANTTMLGILFLPLVLITLCRMRILYAAMGYVWAFTSLYLCMLITGVRVNITGKAAFPKKRPYIVASKHQSAFETIFFGVYTPDPMFVLKDAVKYIPIFGWYVWLTDMIFVSRKRAVADIRAIVAGIDRLGNRVLVLFPEGTRVAYGTHGKVKSSVKAIRKHHPDVTIVACALDAGRIWSDRNMLIKPGIINIHFTAIPQSCGPDTIVEELNKAIEIK